MPADPLRTRLHRERAFTLGPLRSLAATRAPRCGLSSPGDPSGQPLACRRLWTRCVVVVSIWSNDATPSRGRVSMRLHGTLASSQCRATEQPLMILVAAMSPKKRKRAPRSPGIRVPSLWPHVQNLPFQVQRSPARSVVEFSTRLRRVAVFRCPVSPLHLRQKDGVARAMSNPAGGATFTVTSKNDVKALLPEMESRLTEDGPNDIDGEAPTTLQRSIESVWGAVRG